MPDAAHPSPRPAPVPLGLLEYLDLAPGRSAAAKRRLAFAGAVAADRLGYRRVWVPEHHGAGSASTNPVPLVAVLGSHTTRARVGTAVSLTRIRDPHLTAEDFVTAGAFCGDRLDVGLGRGAVGGPGAAVWAHLHADDAATDRAISTLVAVLDDGAPGIDPLGAPYQRWLHGAGYRSAELAAALGFDYCHALFLNPDRDGCLRTLAAHRAARPAGRTAVAVVVAANPDPATARADAARQTGVHVARAGTAEACAAAVRELLAHDEVDEVVLAEVSRDPATHLAALAAVLAGVADGRVDGAAGPGSPAGPALVAQGVGS